MPWVEAFATLLKTRLKSKAVTRGSMIAHVKPRKVCAYRTRKSLHANIHKSSRYSYNSLKGLLSCSPFSFCMVVLVGMLKNDFNHGQLFAQWIIQIYSQGNNYSPCEYICVYLRIAILPHPFLKKRASFSEFVSIRSKSSPFALRALTW